MFSFQRFLGSLVHHDFHITIQSSSGNFDFRLFDHVQVISTDLPLIHTPCHAISRFLIDFHKQIVKKKCLNFVLLLRALSGPAFFFSRLRSYKVRTKSLNFISALLCLPCSYCQVRITVLKSRAHAQSLKMELVSMETRQRPPPGEMGAEERSQNMKRVELVQVRFIVSFVLSALTF